MENNGGPFPLHCIKRTVGAEKIPETPQEYIIVNPGEYHKIADAVENTTPIYFSKPTYDVFENQEITRFLKEHSVRKAFVIGVATDYCIKAAVLGMLNLGIHCYIQKSQIAGVDKKTTEEALNEMIVAGAEII